MKVILIAGARPNFIKIAPIWRELKSRNIETVILHTGQHYDKNMSSIFFEEFGLPEPDINLGVGSKPYSEQIVEIINSSKKVFEKEKPDIIIVVGDVNSTLACTIVAKELGIKVAHIESGLRSFDWRMTEEINRVITDRLSDILFTTENSANINLENEKIDKSHIHFVGNVMIDSLIQNKNKAIEKSKILEKLKIEKNTFGLLTLHRPETVDNKDDLVKALDIVNNVQSKIKLILPLHPRTKNSLKKFNLDHELENMKNLIIIDPIGYIDFLNLMINSKFVLTDSGGIQEETTYLQIPCLTMRKSTERPVTTEIGTNIMVWFDKDKIIKEIDTIISNTEKGGKIPELWDGKTSKRIVDILLSS